MLETIWFILWGVLWAAYFMLDGFDLGLGTLLPFLAKDETDRRIIYSSMGPFWNGNEVWLLTAGGSTFAAFSAAYATMFSAMYTPLMLLLFAIIIRGIAFEYRGKIDDSSWRARWDKLFVVGSALPMLCCWPATWNTSERRASARGGRRSKVAHHGSRTSTGEAFVARTRPRLALVSAGHASRFGHPHPEVVARLEAAGARVLRPDRDGAIDLATDGREVRACTARGGCSGALR